MLQLKGSRLWLQLKGSSWEEWTLTQLWNYIGIFWLNGMKEDLLSSLWFGGVFFAVGYKEMVQKSFWNQDQLYLSAFLNMPQICECKNQNIFQNCSSSLFSQEPALTPVLCSSFRVIQVKREKTLSWDVISKIWLWGKQWNALNVNLLPQSRFWKE